MHKRYEANYCLAECLWKFLQDGYHTHMNKNQPYDLDYLESQANWPGGFSTLSHVYLAEPVLRLLTLPNSYKWGATFALGIDDQPTDNQILFRIVGSQELYRRWRVTIHIQNSLLLLRCYSHNLHNFRFAKSREHMLALACDCQA